MIRPQTRSAAVFGLATTLAFCVAPAPAGAQRGPDVIADVVEQVMETVVNISTASNVPSGRSVPMPQLPPGTPFQEFFEEFFGRRGQPGPGQPSPDQQQRRASSLGSGFVIDASGIIVTNNHVIENADEITAILHDGARLRATLVGRDPRTDLAVLRVEVPAGRTLKAARFGDSERVRVGEWVIAIGNPLGFGGTVTAGILSARNRDIQSGPYDSFLQTDAPINRGNSGGPLFNTAGEVIGINTAIVSPTGGSIGIGFAIPANLARGIVQQLAEFGETRRGELGVRIQSVSEDIAESLGLGRARGALVSGVTPNGPAASAGIQTGDVILRFDGRDIREMRDLPRIVAETAAGKTVPVMVFRAGREQELQATVGRLDESAARQASARPGGRDPAPRAPPPADANRPVLGMTLSGITAELRRQYRLTDDARGVVVTRVEGGSPAAERGIAPGALIVEVAQEAVAAPEDVTKRLDQLREQGRRVALLLIANAQGELRFVTLNIPPAQP
jgi:serine protease Do